jgi:hypothetical protein
VKRIKILLMVFCLIVIQSYSYAQSQSEYLILQDIGSYKFKTQSKNPITKRIKTIPGYWIYKNSGALMGTGHFVLDHVDTTYETVYENKDVGLGVEVKVTQHTGGDSDRWLLHEVEDNYHDDEMETLGLLTDGAVMRKIDNKRILWLGIGGGTFRWVSNNVVINVSYTDLQGAKLEPIEVVKAYLAKFPSTITTTDAELKASAHNVQWIKDEIDRRLWLCDKWNAQFQAGGVTQADLIYNLVRSMKVFLNYRQKYYGIAAEADLKLLAGYQLNKDIASIQTKLSEYKGWWSTNKARSISLP